MSYIGQTLQHRPILPDRLYKIVLIYMTNITTSSYTTGQILRPILQNKHYNTVLFYRQALRNRPLLQDKHYNIVLFYRTCTTKIVQYYRADITKSSNTRWQTLQNRPILQDKHYNTYSTGQASQNRLTERHMLLSIKISSKSNQLIHSIYCKSSFFSSWTPCTVQCTGVQWPFFSGMLFFLYDTGNHK